MSIQTPANLQHSRESVSTLGPKAPSFKTQGVLGFSVLVYFVLLPIVHREGIGEPTLIVQNSVCIVSRNATCKKGRAFISMCVREPVQNTSSNFLKCGE
jgi:hypothetical protein